MASRYPRAVADGAIDEARLLDLREADQVALGRVLFQYHCSQCHAATEGFSAVSHLTRGWTPEMVRLVVEQPDRLHFFMPPWSGTPEEAKLLASYLRSIQLPAPAGMDLGEEGH